MNKIHYVMNLMATDPEFGFGGDGGMLPSTKFVPKKGVSVPIKAAGLNHYYQDINSDGFNAEMQVHLYGTSCSPIPVSCIAHMLDEIYYGLMSARKIAKSKGAKILVGDLVKINKRAARYAPEECWVSGCNPTLDVKTGVFKEVLPDYKKEVMTNGVPLGGHIHFIQPPFTKTGNLSEDIEQGAKFVKFATAVALLPMIMLGFNETKIKRYRMLGLGNFRLPAHGGIEMKDFSGSALGSLPMFALQYTLCRQAFGLYMYSKEAVKAITKAAPFEKIETAVMSGDLNEMDKLLSSVAKIVRQATHEHVNNPYHLYIHENGCAHTLKTKVPLIEFMIKNPDLFVTDDIDAGWGGFKQVRRQDKGIMSSFRSGYNTLINDKKMLHARVVEFSK